MGMTIDSRGRLKEGRMRASTGIAKGTAGGVQVKQGHLDGGQEKGQERALRQGSSRKGG